MAFCADSDRKELQIEMTARALALWSGLRIGSALLLYAACALLSLTLSVPPALERKLSPLIGLGTGAITGITGVFVMPAVPFLQALRLDRDELVQALGLSFKVSTVALAFGLVTQGALRLEQLDLSAFAVVPALVGMWLGQTVRVRISPKLFRLCSLLFLSLLGLELVSRPFRGHQSDGRVR